jgi:hypothetical protein
MINILFYDEIADSNLIPFYFGIVYHLLLQTNYTKLTDQLTLTRSQYFFPLCADISL